MSAVGAVCLRCERIWEPAGLAQCPWCGHPTEATDLRDAPLRSEPGVAFAPAVDAARAARLVREAVREVPFANRELGSLPERLQLVWLPRWRVSADLDVPWEGLGPDGALRAGRLTRRLELRVPACAGPVRRTAGDPVTPAGPWAWPSRPPSEQGHEVAAAARAAVEADQGLTDTILGDVDATGAAWLLEHVPAWVAWYRDDDGVVRTVVVDAADGAVAGPRLASRQVATAWAARQTIVGLAALALAAGLALVGVIVWPLLPGAATAGLISLSFLLSGRSAGPIVARWNRAVDLEEVPTRA